MSFISDMMGSPVLTDRECDQFAAAPIVRGEKMSFGYQPRDYDLQPTVKFCSPLPPDFVIPRDEWDAIIRAQEENQATLRHVRDRAGIKTKSQNGTNYCWAFGTVAAVQLVRAAAGMPTVALSPTAVAAQVTKYRNVGGNTFDAIPWIAEHGVPTVGQWPLNKIDRQYATAETANNAANYRLTEWYELKSNSFDQAASCLLRGIPVILGLMWWGHMVCGVRLVSLGGGKYGIEIENSHGEGYGEKGLAVLPEQKATAFDQAAPRVVTPHSNLI